MDPEHKTRPAEHAGDVPQTPAQGPCPTEEAALSWIEPSITHCKFVARSAPTRENALALTKLEEARFWARHDLELKLEAKGEDQPAAA
jgi:hypothetical protein